jgi:hypothetical protein
MSQLTLDNQPRLAQEVRQQLNELLEIKRSVEKIPNPKFADKVSLQSIIAHEAELRDELRAAGLIVFDASADFVLDGEPIKGHDVPAQLLGAFLEKLQLFVYAIGQAHQGDSTDRARFPQRVIQANKLFVQPEFIVGSFGFRVRVPSKEDLHQLMDTGAEEVLQTACRVLGEDDPSEDTIKLLSHSRVKTHYAGIVDLLVKKNADLSIRHRNVTRTVRLSSTQARKRIEWLEQFQVSEKIINQVGDLVGGSTEYDQFELKTESGIIRGNLSEQAKDDMKKFHWGDTVTATLRIVTTEHEDMSTGITEKYFAEQFISE